MIKLMADSTCDLSDEILEKYDISIAPLTVTMGDEIYRDRVDIFPDYLYSIMDSLEQLPKTAMPSPVEYINIFEESIKKGYKEILCISMSSGTSGSYQSAEIAKTDFYDTHEDSDVKIHIVDSKCMSHGSGYLLIKSAMLREHGATFQELIDFNETYKTNVKHFLSVDDINNLIKSGRLANGLTAMVGKMLNIKPIMTMKNSRGSVIAKMRGRKKVLSYYINEYKERVDTELTDFLIVGYTSDKKYALKLKDKIIADTGFEGEIFVMQMGVAVGTHVGLGGISMYFIEKGHHHENLIFNEMKTLLERKDKMLKMMKKYRDERFKK